MGYRTDIARRYFTHTANATEWPACAILALGILFLGPGAANKRWVSRILPKTVNLRFKRFKGITASANPADVTHHQVLREFLFEDAYNLARVPFSPRHVVDCGAHIGLFLRLCRAHFPEAQLTGFEPQDRNFAFAASAAPAAKLDMYKAAVGAEDGSVVFDDEAGEGFGSVTETGSAERPGSHIVTLVSLPRFLGTLGDAPLLLKIDIEGAERKLLPEIVERLPRSCALFLETHHGESGWSDAMILLTNHGFRGERLRTFGSCVDGFFLRT